MTIKFNEKIKKFIVYKKSKPSIRLKNNPKKQKTHKKKLDFFTELREN